MKTSPFLATIAAACLMTQSRAATALTDQGITSKLEARFCHDRTGACVVAALVDGKQVARATYCARPRADGGPGLDAAFEVGSITKTMTAFLVADLIDQGKWSLDDMVKYVQAELGTSDTPLSGRMRMTQQPIAHGFGMNWSRVAIKGHDLLLHEGGTGGFSSLVALEPAQQRAVVILADTALTDLGGLGDLGLALLGIDVPLRKPRVTAPIPATLRAALQGDYELAGLSLRIWDDAGHLMGQAAGQSAFELFFDDHGDLYPAMVSALLTPLINDGKVNAFAWRQGGGVLEGVRKGSRHAASAENPAAHTLSR